MVSLHHLEISFQQPVLLPQCCAPSSKGTIRHGLHLVPVSRAYALRRHKELSVDDFIAIINKLVALQQRAHPGRGQS